MMKASWILRLTMVAVTIPGMAFAQSMGAEARRRPLGADPRPLFLQHCAVCHGADGDGKGQSRDRLSSIPRDFTRGEYKIRSTPLGAPPTKQDIMRTIRVGMPGTDMPGWGGRLSDRQIDALAELLMSMSPTFSDLELRKESINVPQEFDLGPEAVARGKALYAKLGCVLCHGESGKGDGPVAPSLRDSAQNPIQPGNLTHTYFKGGKGPEVVYRAISTGLAGTPMPNFYSVASDDERKDLTAYVISLGESAGLLTDLFTSGAGRTSIP